MKANQGAWKITNERTPSAGKRLRRSDLARFAHKTDEWIAANSKMTLRAVRRMRGK